MPNEITPPAREARLFRNGGEQAVRIPAEFELPGERVLVHREGDRLIIEPMRRKDIVALLATLEPIEEDFPDFDADQGPAREVDV